MGLCVPELPGFSKTRFRRILSGIALCALLCLGVAQIPLERTAPIARLREELSARLDASVTLGTAHLDLLAARGVVLEEIALTGRGWSLSLDRAVWRPRPAGLLAADGRSSLTARSFALAVDPERLEPGELAASLFEREETGPASLALSGGRLVVADGAPLLEDMSIEVGNARFEVRGRQRAGGRLDLRGLRTPDGALEVDVFLEALAVDALERPLAAALPEPMLPALGIAVAGHWNARFEPAGHRRHRFGLELYAGSPDAPDAPGGSDAAPRLRAQLRGALATRPDPTSAQDRVFESGSHVVLNGRVRRLRTAGAGVPGLHISGPFSASLVLTGPAEDPGLHGSLFLDEAHVRVGKTLRKPCGVRARLGIESGPESGAEVAERGPERRVTRVRLDLGALRLALVRHGGGVFEGASDWVALGDLASWLPAAEDRASGGRVRLTHLRLASADDFDAELAFEAASFAGRRSPLPLSGLTGRGRLTPAGFTAEGIAAALAGVPVRLDISALRSSSASAPRMRFAVRAGEIDLEGLGLPVAGAAGEAWSGALPSALVAAAEPPMALLRRRLESFAHLEVAAGRFEVARLRAGAELLSDVQIDVALQALRLDVSRLSFRQRGRRTSYSGSIDLDRLVPIVEFASMP
jgi:hypothetical protein